MARVHALFSQTDPARVARKRFDSSVYELFHASQQRYYALYQLIRCLHAVVTGARMCAQVRRSHVLEDALNALLPLGARAKGPLHVSYVDAHGMAEAGAHY